MSFEVFLYISNPTSSKLTGVSILDNISFLFPIDSSILSSTSSNAVPVPLNTSAYPSSNALLPIDLVVIGLLVLPISSNSLLRNFLPVGVDVPPIDLYAISSAKLLRGLDIAFAPFSRPFPIAVPVPTPSSCFS